MVSIANNSQNASIKRTDQINEFGGTDLLDAGLRAIARGWNIFPEATINKEWLLRRHD
jgi:hypothetical protein